MNIYLVVEGKTEKKVYAKWAQIVNPNLQIVNDIGDVSNNHLYIISGGGYPSYFDVIEAGVNDVEENDAFDRLVVAVDSEQMSYREKHAELTDCILGLNTNIDFRIVVQHFCLETWALGNRLIVSRYPQSKKLTPHTSRSSKTHRPHSTCDVDSLEKFRLGSRWGRHAGIFC